MFGNKEKNEERFVGQIMEVEEGGLAHVYTDKKTGVQYLFIYSGSFAGGVVLVDENGKPLLNEEYRKNK